MVDLIVVGGGPGGYLGAERAAQAGLKTLLIEKREVGGVCLNEGCIPTKSLLYSAKLKEGAAHGEKYGVRAAEVSIDHSAVIKRKNKVVATLVGGVKAKLKAAGVTLVNGEAYLLGRSGEGFEVRCGEERHIGKRLLICTGSVPVVPPIPGLKEALEKGFAVTSREILDTDKVPARLVIVGGGVIGLEMANYFAAAGAGVTVIEMLDHIGGAIDTDISAILQRNLEKKGIRFLLGQKVARIKDDSVVCEGKNGETEIKADTVLLSIGRRAFTDGLGLENLNVLTERGAIVTDGHMQTNVPGVYAAGDVNGRSMLAHTAYREAEAAVRHMTGVKDEMRYDAIPGVIYTNPEAAGVGETEASAKAKGLDVAAKAISMNFSGRYLAENERGDGILKVIVSNKTQRIVGLHMIGSYASEMIYGACMMIGREMSLESIRRIVFPHPTVSEIIRESLFEF